MNNYPFDDEIVLIYDRVQDKLPLPAMVAFFSNVAGWLNTTESDELSYHMNVLGAAHGYLLHSGKKILADYFINLPDYTPNALTGDVVDVLLNVVSASYMSKWRQLRDAYNTRYAPLDGIDYTESHSRTHVGNLEVEGNKTTTDDESQSFTHGEVVEEAKTFEHGQSVTSSETVTHGKVVGTDSSVTFGHGDTETTVSNPGQITTTSAIGGGDTSVYGFNSSNAVPSALNHSTDSETVSLSGTDRTEVTRGNNGTDVTTGSVAESGTTGDAGSVVYGGTDTTDSSVRHSGTDASGKVSSGSEEISRTENASDNEAIEIARRGRFARTAQELIEQELKARQHTFEEQIYRDLDSILTIDVY